ncbi:Uncharacterised protein [Raoultella ornithinolytica]|nr:Uncharacterised protein [Raoultella ornithinolytica]
MGGLRITRRGKILNMRLKSYSFPGFYRVAQGEMLCGNIDRGGPAGQMPPGLTSGRGAYLVVRVLAALVFGQIAHAFQLREFV